MKLNVIQKRKKQLREGQDSTNYKLIGDLCTNPLPFGNDVDESYSVMTIINMNKGTKYIIQVKEKRR